MGSYLTDNDTPKVPVEHKLLVHKGLLLEDDMTLQEVPQRRARVRVVLTIRVRVVLMGLLLEDDMTLQEVPHTVQLSILEQLLHRNEKRFRGGRVFKAHRRLHHSTLDWRAITKKRRRFGEYSWPCGCG